MGARISNEEWVTSATGPTDDIITVLASGLEPFPEQPFEILERLTVQSSKNFDILEGKFERGCLEPNVARRITQHEAEVNVDEMSGQDSYVRQ
jgi:hypothetical protein